MENEFIESVYDTLCGLLIEEAQVPGVENIFAEGKACMNWYKEILAAYGRLRDRLGVRDEDEDVEIIMDAFLSICRKTGYHMYRYGALFGERKAENPGKADCHGLSSSQ